MIRTPVQVQDKEKDEDEEEEQVIPRLEQACLFKPAIETKAAQSQDS